MTIDLNDYSTGDDRRKVLIYQGQQISVTIEDYGSYDNLKIYFDSEHVMNIQCTQKESLRLAEDIEKALVYNRAEHPQMFL